MTCALCRSDDTELFLARDSVPVHQNVLFETAEQARQIRRGELRMTVCRSCGFVFNAAFDPELLTYERGYDSDQTFSPFFEAHISSLVRQLTAAGRVDGKLVVEIGCGNGYFLKRVIDASKGGRGIGYDPSYGGDRSTADGRIDFVRSTFPPARLDSAPDVVICRHVIEHLVDPVAMVEVVRRAAAPGALVAFETPAVEWILRNTVVWDFFYEHCSLFSAASLARLFEAAGCAVDHVSSVFGGQYLWLLARASDGDIAGQPHSRDDLVALCRTFAAREKEVVGSWSTRVAAAAARGPVAVWGSAAKGSTLVNLVDPACESIDCLVDVNVRRQGRFVAGTGHPIVPPSQLRERNISTAILTNPNYGNEIRELVAESGIDIELVTP